MFQMNTKRKAVAKVIALLLILFVVIVYYRHWVSGAPERPATILAGDYTYTKEIAEFRIRRLMEEEHLPGVAVALIDDQEVIWQETFGWGNLEKETPATTATVFKLWSLAKVFTAIETMRMVEEGLVDLDVPITTYLPDFSVQSRFQNAGPITIRSILTHRSGLPRNECHWLEMSRDGLKDIAASVEDCRQAYPVNFRFKYSNLGIDVLGYLVEEIRGSIFPDYLRAHLLRPLGMQNSAFLRSQVPSGSDIAFGYEYFEGVQYPYEQRDINNLPSGNLYANLDDLARFMKFIFNEGRSVSTGQVILKPESLDRMFTLQPSAAGDPQQMGLGWKITTGIGSEKVIWHDGGPGEGIGSLVAFLPESKLGVILVANGTALEGNISLQFAVDLLELMLETKFGGTAHEEAPLEKTISDFVVPEDYIGKFIAFREVLEVFQRGNQLKASMLGLTFDLDPLSETTFQPRNWLFDIGLAGLFGIPIDLRQLQFEFLEGDSGEITISINLGGLFYELCPRYPDRASSPMAWEQLTGSYNLVAHYASGVLGTEVLGDTRITLEGDVLRMAGFVGPIFPICETEIIILSGPFDGETMLYEAETGRIYHQNIVFIRK